MASKVKVGNIGTVFEVEIKDQDGAIVDISNASTKEMKFRKPSGALLTKTAVLVNAGTDGKMKYTSIAGDLDVAGEWRVEGHVVIPGEGDWKTLDEYRFNAVKALA